MMNFVSKARVVRRAPARVESRRSSGSVEVTIAGWTPPDGALDSHGLRLLVRDGGVRLGEAVDVVDRVLQGQDVTVALAFADRGAAIEALRRLGARAA